MYKIVRTDVYERWEASLRDRIARMLILRRLSRLECGHYGDVANVGGNIFELRIHHGPGYRLYCTHRGGEIVILLCGGDKGSQSRDIAMAKHLKKEIDGAG